MNFAAKLALPITISALAACLTACDSDSPQKATEDDIETPATVANAVDYSKGRAMNKRLGRGINLGNSWDSPDDDDGGWGNPIKDTDFAIIKAAGFNSIRLPVRWQYDSDYSTHTVNPKKMAGVIEDIQLAISNGLAVVVNFHHYVELNEAGGNYSSNPNAYNAEKEHFLGLWQQVATELNALFPDSMLVFEILNEPTIKSAEIVDNLLNEAYQVIRTAAPGKTIMFESYHAAKFADLDILHLPNDGNIIYSGHYYEPYTYSHQGHQAQYKCIGDKAYANTAIYDMANYRKQAKRLYPDSDGINHIPLNMGEFGISGGGNFAKNFECGETTVLPSAKMKAEWAYKTVVAAEDNNMSWHYWGFTKVGGFEAYDRNNDTWYEGFPQSLIIN